MTDTNHGISLASPYRLPARAVSINNLVDGGGERGTDRGRQREREEGDRRGEGLMVGEANGRAVAMI